MSELEVIDVLPGTGGDTIVVGAKGAYVVLAFGTGGQEAFVFMGADAREAFAKAWTEACRRADGEPPAVQAREPLGDVARQVRCFQGFHGMGVDIGVDHEAVSIGPVDLPLSVARELHAGLGELIADREAWAAARAEEEAADGQ